MLRNIRFGFVVSVILMAVNLAEANYDYSTGRWLQRDPLGVNPAGGDENPFQVIGQNKDGTNLYEYVKSNPLVRLDPMGTIYGPIFAPPGYDPIPDPSFCLGYIAGALTKPYLAGRSFNSECGDWAKPIYKTSWPFTHCVWSCRMARDKGRDFAWSCGIKKEKFDGILLGTFTYF